MNFYVKRGDTATLTITTGGIDPRAFTSLIFTVKESLGDTDAEAVIQKLNGYGLTANADSVTVNLAHVDTYPLDAGRTYQYDVQGSDASRVITLAQGQLRASLDVTRELSQSISVYTTLPVNPATLAAEAALRSIADASLSTAISAADSSRVGADASLSTALSTLTAADIAETSTRVSADVVLSAAISSEVSRAQSVEALKAALSHTHAQADVTGLVTALAGKEPSIAAASAYLVMQGDKTFANRIPSFSTATLLAIPATNAAQVGHAFATDAYRLDGTTGPQLCEWRGNSSAGVWCIAGTSVPVTTSRIVFLRGLAKAGLMVRGPNLRGMTMSRKGRTDYAVSNAGTNAYTYASSKSAYEGATLHVENAGGYVHRAVANDNNILNTNIDFYYRVKAMVNRAGTATDNAGLWLGMLLNNKAFPGAGTEHCALAVLDAQNGLGLLSAGSSNITFITGNGTNRTETPSSISAVGSVRAVEVHVRAKSGVDFYIDEALIGTHTTNLPTPSPSGLAFDEGLKSTAYASVGTDADVADIYQATLTY